MLSSTCFGVLLNQVGTDREYGMAEALMPLPLLWRRPMIAVLKSSCRSGVPGSRSIYFLILDEEIFVRG